ncbi:MAG: response regulator [Planctomycetes bacterium]|nr:response regulator [Planctomycetota bacterium]
MSFDLPQILLIDDSRPDLDLVQEACSDAGVHAIFHLCHDGRDAIQFLTRPALESVTLDLIVLDLFLPRTDGFSVLEFLQRSDHRLGEIPVLVLTGSGDMRHVERCFKLGAAFYLWKPAMYQDYTAIAHRIAELLHAPPRTPRPTPSLVEREDLMLNVHSPGRWAGLGG